MSVVVPWYITEQSGTDLSPRSPPLPTHSPPTGDSDLPHPCSPATEKKTQLPSHRPFLYFSFAAAYLPPFFSASTTTEQRPTVPLFRVQSSSFASYRSPFSGRVRPSPVAFATGADTAVKVDFGKKPVTRIKQDVEGDVEEKFTIHIQHLSSLPAFLILSNELAYGSGAVNDKHHIKPLIWRHCSHVSTAPVECTLAMISEPFPSSLDPLAEAPKTLYVDTREVARGPDHFPGYSVVTG